MGNIVTVETHGREERLLTYTQKYAYGFLQICSLPAPPRIPYIHAAWRCKIVRNRLATALYRMYIYVRRGGKRESSRGGWGTRFEEPKNVRREHIKLSRVPSYTLGREDSHTLMRARGDDATRDAIQLSSYKWCIPRAFYFVRPCATSLSLSLPGENSDTDKWQIPCKRAWRERTHVIHTRI